MKTEIRTTPAFLGAVGKCVATISLITMFAFGAAGQTNTFPTSGNVGVGTTTPSYPLTVNQTGNSVNKVLSLANDSSGSSAQTAVTFFEGATEKFKFGMNSSGANGYVGGANAFQLWHFQDAPIVFGTNSTERMRINGAGNIGIGTTNPGRPLVVAADASGIPLRVFRNVNNVGYGTGINWAFNNSAGNVTDYGYINSSIVSNTAGSENGTLGFFTVKAGTLTQQAIINQNGNFGIGTTTPLDTLQLDSSAGWALRIRYTGDGQYLRLSANQISSYTSGGVGRDLYLNTDGGKVGIGTTTPAYKLDVAGEIRSSSGGFRFPDGTVQTTAATGGGSQWVGTSNIYHSGGNVAIGTENPLALLDVRNTDGYFYAGFGYGANKETYLRAGSAANGIMHIGDVNTTKTLLQENGGNVGIGIAAPTEKLHVSGNGKFTGNLTVDGNINAKYQDLAEWVPSSEQLSAGTVVVLDATKSNQVISSTLSYDTRVAGVISTQPGITLGESGEGKVLVATTGRVRVKVDASRGPIQIGDLLVTSDVAGVAMKSEPVELAGRKMHMPGTIIGKALEPLAKGKGEILVLLSLQ